MAEVTYDIRKKEICRPDFESRIANLTENLSTTKNLFDALEEFIIKRPLYLYRFNKNSLASLLGHVYVEKRSIEAERETWIRKQEEYKKKGQG